ncbi:TPA: hypothetical protein HA225_02715 [Candidatus Micrarchaeota archaeon]|nr:hypothetical protein [Candidatus Micrarchaeota archaeon]
MKVEKEPERAVNKNLKLNGYNLMQHERARLPKRVRESALARRAYQCCIVLLEARARELMLRGEAKAEAKASGRIARKARRAKARAVTLIRLEADVN